MNKNSNLFILIGLGLVWSSFAAFTKVSAATLSPFFVSFCRLFLGLAMIWSACFLQRKNFFIRENFKHYAIVGFFNSAFPFTLFAVASRYVDSGVAAILDGAVPMFEVLISIFILKRFVSRSAIFGIIFGVIGVMITYYGGTSTTNITWSYSLAVAAILVATVSYAVASIYLNEKCKNIDPMIMAAGSVFVGSIIMSPSLLFTDFSVTIDLKTMISLLGLGLICTGFAYILYFRLIAEEGPRVAVSVVLLIPVFGTIFGWLFLDEPITTAKIIGCITILVSMKFLLNLSLQNFLPNFTQQRR